MMGLVEIMTQDEGDGYGLRCFKTSRQKERGTYSSQNM